MGKQRNSRVFYMFMYLLKGAVQPKTSIHVLLCSIHKELTYTFILYQVHYPISPNMLK